MKRIAALVGVIALGVAAYASGVFELLGDQERIRALLEESGAWGPVLYVLAFALLEPFGIPGIFFVVPASLVWPLWWAGLLSWIGSIGAGVVGFSFARWIGKEWVERHLTERMRAYDERLAERGLQTVIVVRLLFFLTPPAHWALGLSKVRFGPFVLGTAIGFIPGIAAITLIGRGLFGVLSDQPRGLWVAVGIAIAVALFLRNRNRRAAQDSAADG